MAKALKWYEEAAWNAYGILPIVGMPSTIVQAVAYHSRPPTVKELVISTIGSTAIALMLPSTMQQGIQLAGLYGLGFSFSETAGTMVWGTPWYIRVAPAIGTAFVAYKMNESSKSHGWQSYGHEAWATLRGTVGANRRHVDDPSNVR